MNHNRLDLDPALILALTKIRPRIQVLPCQKQAQSFHQQVRTTFMIHKFYMILLIYFRSSLETRIINNFGGYKVEEKLHLGVREQDWLITADLQHSGNSAFPSILATNKNKRSESASATVALLWALNQFQASKARGGGRVGRTRSTLTPEWQ
jgi:hypothetical protein